MSFSSFFLVCIFLGILQFYVQCCGITTHTEIGHRAVHFFKDPNYPIYENIIKKHQSAFQAGNPYPDAMYNSLCFHGDFHDVAEDTHWIPFTNASAEYIRKTYPQPWDEATEKLVAFFLGFISHQVADVTWHSLGISQGFLETMGNVNFYGSFSDAHSVGDPGGDVISQFAFNTDYIRTVVEWYVPLEDLDKIYYQYYGKDVINQTVIQECTAWLFLGRLGEQLALAETYKHFAQESPFMIDKFTEFFLGGVDDMSVWTTYLWKDAIDMIEYGPETCDLNENPIYLNCDEDNQNEEKVKDNEQIPQEEKKRRKRFDAKELILKSGLTLEDIEIETIFTPKKSIILRPKPSLRQKIASTLSSSHSHFQPKNVGETQLTITTSTSYARLGWVMESSDINNDGLDDLIIGAPGHGEAGNAQYGSVYILLGSTKYEQDPLVIDSHADITLSGTSISSRFGSSLAIVDLNKDGIKDLAVGAPSYGNQELTYTGQLFIFYGKKDTIFSKTADVVINGVDVYENLAWSLSSGDLDSDGFDDLVCGSPYSPASGEQRGTVQVFFSSTFSLSVNQFLLQSSSFPLSIPRSWFSSSSITLTGSVNYEWFGFSTHVYNNLLFVGSPNFRICDNKDCSYSDDDTQSVGRIYCFEYDNSSMLNTNNLVDDNFDSFSLNAPSSQTNLLFTITDSEEFNQFGTSLSVGFPFDLQKTPVLAVSSITATVQGTKDGKTETWDQAGRVHLIDLTSLLDGSPNDYSLNSVKVLSQFDGDRRYDRFGSKVGFVRLNGDEYDDLFISSPMRTENVSELIPDVQQGGLYIFYGGSSFPKGKVTYQCPSNTSVTPCPGSVANFSLEPTESQTRFSHYVHPLNFFNSNVQNSNSQQLAVSSLFYSGPFDSPRLAGRVEILSTN